MPKHAIALLGSAFLLSACLGSGSSTPTASVPGGTTGGTTGGDTPQSGALTYRGTVSGAGSAAGQNGTMAANLSMTALVTNGSGNVTAAEMSDFAVRTDGSGIPGTGSFAFTGNHPVTNNAFANLPLTGTVNFTDDGITFPLTSGGANTVTLGGTFTDGNVNAILGGSASSPFGTVALTSVSGVLRQPQ